MDRSLNVGYVAETLPDFDSLLEDARLRPFGLVGGFSLVLIGALLGIPTTNAFWSSVVSGVLVFVGVPLFCLGLAAPDPEDESDLFNLGINLTRDQRRLVALGSLLIVFSPITVAVFAPIFGFATAVFVLAALFTVFGAVLVLTGFVAWTSRALVEAPVSR